MGQPAMTDRDKPDEGPATIPGDAVAIPTTIKNRERIASRRNELIEISTRMFLERGFHNTSVREIVRACSFNLASLYMYVSSKEDILYLVAQDLMTTIAQELVETELDEGSPESSIQLGFENYCRISNKFRRHIRLLYREIGFLPEEPRRDVLATVSSVVSFFETIIEQGIAKGVFRDLPPRLAALDIMMAAHSIALHTGEILSHASLENYITFQKDKILAMLLVDGASATAR